MKEWDDNYYESTPISSPLFPLQTSLRPFQASKEHQEQLQVAYLLCQVTRKERPACGVRLSSFAGLSLEVINQP